MVSTSCTYCAAAATTHCARCQANLCDEHTRTGQQLITARQLVTTIATTAVRAPGLLSEVLLKDLDQVAYCPTCRTYIAWRRQSEQLKFLGGLLLVLLLVVALLAVVVIG
ncbi:MAG: hypothetical protein M3380_12875 [Chloroflexota bacterium]|nr:hypothetical protein [Chloroflexota bacterium]